MQIVQKKYLELKKVSKQRDIDFKKVMSDDYTENEWKKKGRKINLNINNFDNIKNFRSPYFFSVRAKIQGTYLGIKKINRGRYLGFLRIQFADRTVRATFSNFSKIL